MRKNSSINNYNVYEILPSDSYKGSSLIGAESIEEANKIINELKINEPDRYEGYKPIQIENQIVELFSPKKGILMEGIIKENN